MTGWLARLRDRLASAAVTTRRWPLTGAIPGSPARRSTGVNGGFFRTSTSTSALGTGMMRKASQWINQWDHLVLEELGRSLTVFDTKRSLDDTARADNGTARNTRETHLSKVYGVTPEVNMMYQRRRREGGLACVYGCLCSVYMRVASVRSTRDKTGTGTGTGYWYWYWYGKAPINAGVPACWGPRDCSRERPAAVGLD